MRAFYSLSDMQKNLKSFPAIDSASSGKESIVKCPPIQGLVGQHPAVVQNYSYPAPNRTSRKAQTDLLMFDFVPHHTYSHHFTTLYTHPIDVHVLHSFSKLWTTQCMEYLVQISTLHFALVKIKCRALHAPGTSG